MSVAVFVGDSITAAAWWAAPGGLIDQLGALGASLTIVNSGVGGNKVANIDGATAARILDHRPDVVIIHVGVNDASGGTPTATFRASYDRLLSQIRFISPGTSIICVSILLFGELWTSVGPAFAGNAHDAAIDTLNTQIAASAATVGATYVNVRTPAALYESQNNLPEPGAALGFLTGDGLHPNATGQVLMGTAVAPVFSVGTFTPRKPC